jgi:uncharacterized SAM-binding protein YcdF (DUF218 family)
MSPAYYKYIIGHLLSPVSLLLLTSLGCYLLLVIGKKTRGAKIIMGACLFGLYGLSTNFGANLLLAPLEFQYPKFKQPEQSLAYVIVLGCRKSSKPHLPSSSQLHGCSHTRLREGVNIHNNNPGSKLIVTGGALDRKASIAQMMADSAMGMGIDKTNIMVFSKPNNTQDEAKVVATYVVDAPTALVTSAAHMPRALQLFKAQGLELQPAPTDFLIREKITEAHLRYFIPESKNFEKVTSAFHEYYGLLWMQINPF